MKIQINYIFNGGSSSNYMRVLDNYALDNPFFWNRYIVIVKFIEVINFFEVIERIMETIT